MDDLEKRAKDVSARLRQIEGESYETSACYNGLRTEAADMIEALLAERRTPSPATVALVEALTRAMDYIEKGMLDRSGPVLRQSKGALAAYEKESPDAQS